mmetsp:Transcript_43605/g.115163  ORF Transcript_43605/g.115163 Transcript_43605/m.115163 type:complete len:310 (-) Transcript_43605:1010-1939(-)
MRFRSAKMTEFPVWGRLTSRTRTSRPHATRSEYVTNKPGGNLDSCCNRDNKVGTRSTLPISRMHSRTVLTMSRSLNCCSELPPPDVTYCSNRSKCTLTSGQTCVRIWPVTSGMHVMFVSTSKPKTGSASSCQLSRPVTGVSAGRSSPLSALPTACTCGARDVHCTGRDKAIRALASACKLSAGKRERPEGMKSSTKPDFATNVLSLSCTTVGSLDSTGRGSSEPPFSAEPMWKDLKSVALAVGVSLGASSSSLSRVSSSNHLVSVSKKPSPLPYCMPSSPGDEKKGDPRLQRLSKGFPSVPEKSSNSVR